MPNALAVLIPFLVGSFQDVLRQTGFALNGVTLNATAERAAQGQTIQMLASAPQATYAVTPGVVPPAAVDTTPTAKPLIMTQLRGTRFHLTGEDWKSLGSMGPEFRSTQVMEAQAALIHELSGYILGVADLGAG